VSTLIPDIGVARQVSPNLQRAQVVEEMESAFINAINAGVRIGSARKEKNDTQPGRDYQLFMPARKKEQQQRGDPDKAEYPGQMEYISEEYTEHPGAA